MRKALYALTCLFFLFPSADAQYWSKLGSGGNSLKANGDIYVICSDIHSNIYAGGWAWDDSLGVSVYKWDGTSWIELGFGSSALSPYADANIEAIYADTNGNVYAAANHFGTHPGYCYVYKWDGTSWSQLGPGSAFPAADISTIKPDRYGNLYIAGGYSVDSTLLGSNGFVAKWDGTTWSEVGTGASALNANGYIDALFIDTLGNIFAGGGFTDGSCDTTGNLYVAKWDGMSWSMLGSPVIHTYHGEFDIFNILEDTAGNVYASGSFGNDTTRPYVAKWDGLSWSILGDLHFNGAINSMCFDKFGNIYIAGNFTDTTVPAPGPSWAYHPSYVAKWDGTNWSKLGTGSDGINANNPIYSICADTSGYIYAGGGFTDTTISYIDTVPLVDTFAFHPHYIARYGLPPTAVVSVNHLLNLDIYPNPAQHVLNVSAGNIITATTITDATGRIVHTHTWDTRKIQVDISGLMPGAYFLNINRSEVRQFIKE